MQHLAGLNKEQREAALHKKGPLLIVAGAGAGKTKTITHRIVNLIKEGISPDKILAVTFTNKAAKEMRERIMFALGAENLSMGGLSQAGGPRVSAPRTRGDSDPTEKGFSVPFVSTFHSLGVYIIKENARLLGLTKYFTILDEGDAILLIKNILKELGIDPKQYDPKKIKNIISREKGKFTHLEDYPEGKQASYGAGALEGIVFQVWGLYEKQKTKENSLDFDDLLLKATKLLKENEKIRKIYQEKWDYIHVDEYQDTNEVQYLMCKLLSEEHKNIAVVGDSDQLIYSFRGANLKNILNFEKDYPKAKIILLEQNYRSTKNILEAANEIIKKNKYRPDKNLFTDNAEGEKIGLYEALDENDEADFVATKILEILDSSADSSFAGSLSPRARGALTLGPSACESPRKEKSAALLSNIAILYRANFQSRALEEAMLRYNISYQVLGVKFFERKEIKDTLAYLRAALNPDSLSDIKRIINFPARGIGKVTLAKIFAGEKSSPIGLRPREDLPIKMKIKVDNFYQILEEIKEKIKTEKASAVIKFVVKKSGIEQELASGGEEDIERLENIKELATLALKYDNLPAQAGLENGAGVEKLLEDASLASDQDSLIDPVRSRAHDKVASPVDRGAATSNGVKLMTVHASKGLEFKYVFVTGLEDGLFPASAKASAGRPHEKEDTEEERRLFYVALTRAKEKLFLSFANFRTIFGSRNINAPSEFISDIPVDLLEKEGETAIAHNKLLPRS
ncbi:MAG: ATP-dependent DNA helicase PcrA [Candidatus Nomurabacteria bacterium GW2011_GWB1_40_7]|uniref:DNA 3'-5' helicase n=1 Tax=Candidatus Nomurabacteria bacterium GW2011_GWB1_40_7 TaxID=1618744 RepID=A0A0G0SZB9_9BACT|nr:MAG: ATP-dependent DNA helicase PcrA [Candidatus Nomurabacteria bacterium GW2011_GWB1_40_7]